MKLASFLVSALVVAFASAGFAETKALDDTYKFIGLKKDSYEFAKHLLTLDNGKIKIKAEDESSEQVLDLKIEDGAQPEFAATLRANLPAGITMYRGEMDMDGSGSKKKITLVKQTMNETTARLTIYVVEDGRPFAIIKAYDRTQEAALNQAWEEVQ